MGIVEQLEEIWYNEGVELGRKQSTIAFVKSLLLNTDFDISKIAMLAGVTTDFVKNIKEGL